MGDTINKISSYQKLKLRLFQSEVELCRLRNAVADDNHEVLIEAKILVQTGRDINRAFWFGDTSE